MSPKRIKQTDITGERGITLIHDIVLEMGFLWTSTGLEAGIDGYIEARDPKTGIVTNNVIQVQSKATDKEFIAETASGFDFYCEPQDLDYWLGGNAPVILVRSRPSTHEAYWVPIKDYFKDLSTRQTHKIHFDKEKDRFDINCRAALFELARPKDSGLYLSPLPKQETLYSNLLQVTALADKLYIAETDYRSVGALWKKFKDMDAKAGGEWFLKNKRIFSFHNLDEYPWCEICDKGTIEPFDTQVWSDSDDPDYQRDFVRLLNQCLMQKLWPEVRYDRDSDYFYFTAPRSKTTVRRSYKNVRQSAKRSLFQVYMKKGNSTQPSYYRHSAFFGRFLRFDKIWYLEITPTYRFTWDGYKLSPYHQEYLKGIKRLERNPAVFGQVVMWADYVKSKGRPDLFTEQYPFLSFGSLLTFDIEAGIDDKVWSSVEEKPDTGADAAFGNLPPVRVLLAPRQ